MENVVNGSSHTFAVCAYKESPYLEKCIKSLKKQSVQSKIIMVTSTPNDRIRRVSEKYHIPLFVNEGPGGIAQDWNFAYQNSDSEYVTIAHQDDVYSEKYTERMLREVSQDCLIAFSDYAELRGTQTIVKNTNLLIKHMLLFPLRSRHLQKSVWVRRRVLSLGNPICCPSVMYVKKNLPETLFRANFRSNVDWETWEMLSVRKGKFVYIPSVLMKHRIHDDSETSATIQENLRTHEDFEMFKKFWPVPVARMLTRTYAASEKSNEIQEKGGKIEKE